LAKRLLSGVPGLQLLMTLSTGAETILVVEDVEVIRKMVCAMLLQGGYTVLEAGDGKEALRILSQSGPVHLVLTDLIMPHMNGTELALHVSQRHPSLPVIFMSGYNEDPVVRGVECAGSMFLAKPFTAAALADKIRQALDRPRNDSPGASLDPR
jgi:two-component system cell cycle sensor histidine kinase/response regulator CckA